MIQDDLSDGVLGCTGLVGKLPLPEETHGHRGKAIFNQHGKVSFSG